MPKRNVIFRPFFIIFCLCIIICGCCIYIFVVCRHTQTTVLLIRHADKVASYPQDPNNPPLSQAGLDRADTLAHVLGDVDIAAIYRTNFLRMEETIAPLVAELNLPEDKIHIYQPLDISALAADIRSNYSGQSVLVVGHSNTLSTTIVEFGGEPIGAIGETWEYDNLFVITRCGFAVPTVLRMKYGSECKAD